MVVDKSPLKRGEYIRVGTLYGSHKKDSAELYAWAKGRGIKLMCNSYEAAEVIEADAKKDMPHLKLEIIRGQMIAL